MPAITFSKFDVGLDRRKARSVADANRVWQLKNAYITTGQTIRQRPGLSRVAELELGSAGLRAGAGKLNTFYNAGTLTHANTLLKANRVAHPSNSAATVVTVHYCDTFNGYLYVCVEYSDGLVRHHYLDEAAKTAWAATTAIALNAIRRATTAKGVFFEVTTGGTTGGAEPAWNINPGQTTTDGSVTWTCRSTVIADANCPHSKAVTKQASKIFAAGYGASSTDVVGYSATDNPRDWTTASNAGFLPVGVRQSGAATPTALSQFQSQLVVFFSDGAQVWDVDPNPALNQLRQRIYNVGTVFPESPSQLSGDVFFLAGIGYRSLTQNLYTDNLVDFDVGSPIDNIIQFTDASAVQSFYYPAAGQFWSRIDGVWWVYSFSKTSKISAWSQYTFPFTPDSVASFNGELYMRAGNNVYRVDEAAVTDDGAPIAYTVELAFLDFKLPGVLKQIMGVDGVFEGAPLISYRFDPRNEALISEPYPLLADTRPGAMNAVEQCCTSIAPVFTNSGDAAPFPAAFALHSLTFYYEALGPI